MYFVILILYADLVIYWLFLRRCPVLLIGWSKARTLNNPMVMCIVHMCTINSSEAAVPCFMTEYTSSLGRYSTVFWILRFI